MNQSTEKCLQTSKGSQWVDHIVERVKNDEKLHRITFEQLAYNFAGPSNKKARQQTVEYMTGKKEPVSKCGVTIVTELLKKHVMDKTGIDISKR